MTKRQPAKPTMVREIVTPDMCIEARCITSVPVKMMRMTWAGCMEALLRAIAERRVTDPVECARALLGWDEPKEDL